MTEDQLSYLIIGAAIEAHRELGGPGLLENIYEEALCEELSRKNLRFVRQQPVSFIYKGKIIKNPLIIDILVEDKVIVEVKATEKNQPIFEAQLLTYLRLTRLKLGLLINFGQKVVKEGISRVVNEL